MQNPILPSTHQNVNTYRPCIKISQKANQTTMKTTKGLDEMIQKLGRGLYGEEYQKKKRAEIPYKSGIK